MNHSGPPNSFNGRLTVRVSRTCNALTLQPVERLRRLESDRGRGMGQGSIRGRGRGRGRDRGRCRRWRPTAPDDRGLRR